MLSCASVAGVMVGLGKGGVIMSEIKIRMRADQLEAMHRVIQNTNDEEIYYTWILVVPDEPSREDFEELAADDADYNEVCDLFVRLIQDHNYRV